MKKLVGFAALMLLVSGYAQTSHAAAITNEGTTDTAVALTDGNDPEKKLTLNFSPSVQGQYITDDAQTAGNKQWFAIGTYHSGGTMFYATSSDQTVVWKKERATTDLFDTAALPTTLDVTAAEDGTVPEVWASWSK